MNNLSSVSAILIGTIDGAHLMRSEHRKYEFMYIDSKGCENALSMP